MEIDTSPPSVKPGLKRQNTISRRSEIDDDGNEKVNPGCFSRNIIKYPCVVLWGSFLTVIVLGLLPLLTGAVSPGLNIAVMLNNDKLPLQVASLAAYGVHESDDIYDKPKDEDDGFNLPLNFYYESLNSERNMFTSDGIKAMATYERALLEVNDWTKHCRNATSRFGPNPGETRCASPQTVLRFLYLNPEANKKQCEEGYCYVVEQADLATCTNWGTFPCMSTVYDWRDGELAPEADWPSLLAQVCTKPELSYTKRVLLQKTAECTADELSSRYVRSLYQVYSPYNESETKDDRGFVDMEESFVDDLIEVLDDTKDEVSATKVLDSSVATGGKAVNIFWDGAWTGNVAKTLGVLAMADIQVAIFSIILVAAIIILNTGSLLLCFAGIFQIIMSIFLAMFCWMCIGQVQVTLLELLGIFLILCVGADDIFVFADTWAESAVMPPPISGTLLTRFSWTYTRAAGAMLTTTATTAVCLLISGASPFPMVQAFGLFNMFIVICDFILVITFFAAAVVCLERLAVSKCAPGKNWEFSCCCPGKVEDGEKKERRSTAWFKNTLAPSTFKARWVLIAISTAMLAGGIAACASQFEDGELKQVPEGHPGFVGLGGTVSDDIADNQFSVADGNKVLAFLYYGLKNPAVNYPNPGAIDIYQSNPDGDDFEDYADGFTSGLNFAPDSFGPDQQKKMVEDCEVLSNNAKLVDGDEHHCLLNDLKDYNPTAFPYLSEELLRSALVGFYASDKYTELTNNYESYATSTGFLSKSDTEVNVLWMSFNSTTPPTLELSASAIKEYYDPWRSAVDKQCNDVAPCLLTDLIPGIYTASRFGYMETAKALEDAAIQNIAIALIVAYFILFTFTGNFLVPLAAIFSIGSTITWVFASILLVGYKFDVVMSILVVMIVGMSVDYAAHIVHFYNEMGGNRYEKVQGALHGVGVSVIGGAVTTAGAALPLLFTQNLVMFKEMGYFILFTALWGVFFSFAQLVPILMVCGPVGETGDIRALIRRIRGGPSMKAVSSTTDAGTRVV